MNGDPQGEDSQAGDPQDRNPQTGVIAEQATQDIELTVNADYDNFTEEDQRRFIEGISS